MNFPVSLKKYVTVGCVDAADVRRLPVQPGAAGRAAARDVQETDRRCCQPHQAGQLRQGIPGTERGLPLWVLSVLKRPQTHNYSH